MADIIIFAGTTEGRKLSSYLVSKGVKVAMCVATDYAQQLVHPNKNLETLKKRLNAEEMQTLIRAKKCTLIIDATHPYATEVTKNIRLAAKQTGAEYLRLVRSESEKQSKYIYVSSAKEAAEYLEENPMKTLLTIGSKELAHFTKVPDFADNIFARVLPFAQVVQTCTELGFQGKQLICMQGPFTTELNIAMIKSLQVQCVVTKDSGETGGFIEKCQAAEQTNSKLIIIGRPSEESGYSFEVLKQLLIDRFVIAESQKAEAAKKREMFPLFLSLKEQEIVVFGGGQVSERRVKAMVKYGGQITVVSPAITPELQKLRDSGEINYIKSKYRAEHLQGFQIAVAATDNREVNRQIGKDARKLNLLYNVADKKEESDFYFSALIEGQILTAGVISAEGDHKRVKAAAKKLREVWTEIEKDSESGQPQEQAGNNNGRKSN